MVRPRRPLQTRNSAETPRPGPSPLVPALQHGQVEGGVAPVPFFSGASPSSQTNPDLRVLNRTSADCAFSELEAPRDRQGDEDRQCAVCMPHCLIRRHQSHSHSHPTQGGSQPERCRLTCVSATVSTTASVRRTGLDSIPESTLETTGWLDFDHQQEKTLGRRGQLLEPRRASRAAGEMAEQCRLFSPVEHSSGQFGEVCFKSLVGCCLWVDHRETTATSAGRDGCLRVD